MYAPIARRNDADDGSLSKQNIIIIAACCSAGGLLLCYFFYRTIRNCIRSSNPAPLPPVQPLAHHREHTNAIFQDTSSRPVSWLHPLPTPLTDSKTSLLRDESPSLSLPSLISPGQEVLIQPEIRLSLPPRYPGRPGSSSSNISGDTTPNLPASGSSPPLSSNGRSVASIPGRRRPSSMSSAGTTNSRAGRTSLRGLPHGNSTFQIVLPKPISSVQRLTPDSRQSGALDRRSVVDQWLVLGSRSDSKLSTSAVDLRPEDVQQPRPRRPVSMSSAQTLSLLSGHSVVPPVPPLPRQPHSQMGALGTLTSGPERIHDEDYPDSGQPTRTNKPEDIHRLQSK